MISFVNSFLSYIVLLLVIGVAAAVAVTVGITMAKKKNAGKPSETTEGTGRA